MNLYDVEYHYEGEYADEEGTMIVAVRAYSKEEAVLHIKETRPGCLIDYVEFVSK